MTGKRSRRPALLDGALAAAPALATSWVVHDGTPRIPFAPTALADRLIRLTPGGVATDAIDSFGHAAKPLLAVSVTLMLTAAAASVATLIREPARAALAWTIVLVACGASAPVQPSLAGAFEGAAIGGIAYFFGLRALRVGREMRSDPQRRRAIAVIGTFTIGVLAASDPLGRAIAWLGGAPAPPSTRPLAHAPIPQRPAFPAVAWMTPEVTSIADHYVVDIDINKPVVDGSNWRLRLGGLVERPLELGFLDLQRQFTLVDEISVLTCISNPVGGPLVGCSRWEGVRLGELLRRAGPKPSASALVVRCLDGYSAGLPLAAALDPSALVAIAQDGQALSREHGFPCRLRLPALYGMLNPKWVQSIELVDHPYRGYWAQQGWSSSAVVRTESRIDTPGQAKVGKPTWIAGVAWAGIRGIDRVEVSIDGGSVWERALLHKPLSPWAWSQWAYRWTPTTRGSCALVCRATDGDGSVQEATPRPAHPSGASGYHRVQLQVA